MTIPDPHRYSQAMAPRISAKLAGENISGHISTCTVSRRLRPRSVKLGKVIPIRYCDERIADNSLGTYVPLLTTRWMEGWLVGLPFYTFKVGPSDDHSGMLLALDRRSFFY